MYHIIVRTKYQDIFNTFFESFLKTVGNFKVRLYVVHRPFDSIKIPDLPWVKSVPSHTLGNTAFIPVLQKILKDVRMTVDEKNYGYFGIFNDDLIFSNDWLEDVDFYLKLYHCVTPGYINTTDIDKLNKAVEKSKFDAEIIPLSLGSCMVMRLNIFPRIGMLDPQFDWSCDDLDLIWRMKLNGMRSVTLKKITIAHAHGASRVKDMRKWNIASKDGKLKFYNKHGIINYRNLTREYREHSYFNHYEC